MRSLGLALSVALVACLACATPLRPPPRSGWARVGPEPRATVEREDGAVLVHFPPGACATGWLEIQVLSAPGGPWVPHPGGDRLRAGACRFESPERLLNETRVRCYDPAGERPPSAWVVGVEVDGSEWPTTCAEGDA